jgi:hypothetical protein
MPEMVETHLLLPKELLEEIDRRVGPAKRTETIVELVEEYLRRTQGLDVLGCGAGTITSEEHPEWATREDVASWVHEQRRGWEREIEPRNA